MDLKKIAQDLADEIGFINLSREALCERAGISPGSFTYRTGLSFGAFCFQLKPNKIGAPLQRKRVSVELRRQSIIEAARELPGKFTLREVAARAGVSVGTICKLFGTIENLRGAIKDD